MHKEIIEMMKNEIEPIINEELEFHYQTKLKCEITNLYYGFQVNVKREEQDDEIFRFQIETDSVDLKNFDFYVWRTAMCEKFRFYAEGLQQFMNGDCECETGIESIDWNTLAF